MSILAILLGQNPITNVSDGLNELSSVHPKFKKLSSLVF